MTQYFQSFTRVSKKEFRVDGFSNPHKSGITPITEKSRHYKGMTVQPPFQRHCHYPDNLIKTAVVHLVIISSYQYRR